MRGTGGGRSIMRALTEHAARVEGIEQTGLLVATTQAAAIALYQSLGFRLFGCERRALKIGERYGDEEHMVQCLARGGYGPTPQDLATQWSHSPRAVRHIYVAGGLRPCCDGPRPTGTILVPVTRRPWVRERLLASRTTRRAALPREHNAGWMLRAKHPQALAPPLPERAALIFSTNSDAVNGFRRKPALVTVMPRRTISALSYPDM